MARMVRLRVDLRRNCLEHDHYAIPLYDSPEVFAVTVPATFVRDLKPELGRVKIKTFLEVVHDEKWGDTMKS